MADFSSTNITPINVSLPVTSGVSSIPQLTSAQTDDVSLVKGLGSATSSLAKIGEMYFQSEKKVDDAKSLASFTSDQMKIIDAHSQGIYGMSQAQAMLRTNLSDYIAANPLLADDYLKRNGSLVSDAGLGQDVLNGTPQEKAKKEKQDEAMKAGWLDSSQVGTPQADAVVQKYDDFKLYGQQLQRSTDIINNNLKQVELGTAKTNAQKAKLDLAMTSNKFKAENALANMAGTFNDQMTNKLNNIKDMFNSGKIDGVSAQMATESLFSGFTAAVNQVGAYGSADSKQGVIRPIQDLKSGYVDYFSGKTTQTVLDNQVKTSNLKSELAFLHDPEVQNFVAVSKLFDGNAAMDVISNRIASKMLSDNSTNTGRISPTVLPKTADEEKAATVAFKNLQENMDMVFNKDPTFSNQNKDRMQEINNQISNVFKGVNAYSTAVDSPKEFNSIVDLLASNSFGNYANAGGKVSSDTVDKFKDIITANYQNIVVPLIKDRWSQAIRTTSSMGLSKDQMSIEPDVQNYTVSDKLEPKFDGTGVRFTLKDGVKDPTGDIQSEANNLNKEVSPVLNKLIRMDTHLEGSKDYRKTWENSFNKIFNSEVTPKNKDNLNDVPPTK